MDISIDYKGQIDGDYSIIKKIVEGYFSTIYLVKDNKTDIEYVAKVINKYNIYESEKEINKIIKDIKSSNILKLVAYGEKKVEYLGKLETKGCIIFEYCEFGDLFDCVPQGGFEEKIVKIIFQILLEAVEEIHKNGICHLDLKLENILIDKDFNLKISDFGLSKQINKSNNGIFKGSCGTSYYKPPQMNLKENYNGFKADIFSLGVILYALLSERFPFEISDPKNKNCIYYKLINYKMAILETIENLFPKNSTLKSRQLFLDMIARNEKDRPEIKEILKNEWFDDIKDLNNEDKKKLLKEALKQEKEKKDQLNKPIYSKPKGKKNEAMCENKLFDKTRKIKCFKKRIKFNKYIQIIGNFDPIDFMNEFANEMNYLYDDIEADKNNYLNFNIIIKKKENEKEEKKRRRKRKRNKNEKRNRKRRKN